MLRLQKIHAEIGQRAASRPELFAQAGVTKGMEQALLEAIASCLAKPESHRESPGRGHHNRLLRKLTAILEANAHSPIYMPELSAALGVSGRTLRNYCQEQLGMPLNRYLTLRRMYLARQALEKADPAVTRVTDIATEFGFWEFGRFAVAYKSIFWRITLCEPAQELRRQVPKIGSG
jgi:transcriptional regulator GlxA family with amidase domain